MDLSKTPDSDKGGNGVLHEEVRTGTEVPAGGAGHQESGEVCSRKDRWVQVGVSCGISSDPFLVWSGDGLFNRGGQAGVSLDVICR